MEKLKELKKIYVHGAADPKLELSAYGLYSPELNLKEWKYCLYYFSPWEIGVVAVLKAAQVSQERSIRELVIYTSNKTIVEAIARPRRSKYENKNTYMDCLRIYKEMNFDLLDVVFISGLMNKEAKALTVRGLRRARKTSLGAQRLGTAPDSSYWS